MVGCYAQTEIGHGSNVRALQTTATFIPETDEFEMHTPTITATKFWPGSMGRTANTAMVIARLIVPEADGSGMRDHGIHNFIVPIRDRETHLPMPGVKVGDIGPKIGFNNMDNGFLAFDRVRVPRKNMAARYSRVDPATRSYETLASGAEAEVNRKLAGLTMTQVRASIVEAAGRNLMIASTIAVRYSCVRRQGFGESKQSEHQVLDYLTQQHRLLPLIAASFCFHFTGRALATTMQETTETVKAGDPVPSELLAELHATSSGLKALCTTITAAGIETARRACGGHGFLVCAGLAPLSGTYLQNVTVEGDNYLLPQQTCRFLLRALEQARATAADPVMAEMTSASSCRYLWSELRDPQIRCSASTVEELKQPEILLAAMGHRAFRLVTSVEALLAARMAAGESLHDAWNHGLVEVGRASTAHCDFVLLANFMSSVASESRQLSAATGAVLQRLVQLHALATVEGSLADFLEDDFMSAAQAAGVREGVRDLLGLLRPDAVSLVDSFDFDDRQLKSTIGRRDGQVYEALMDAAERNPMNTQLTEDDYRPLVRPLARL